MPCNARGRRTGGDGCIDHHQGRHENTDIDAALSSYPASEGYDFEYAFAGEEHGEAGVHVAEDVADQERGAVVL